MRRVRRAGTAVLATTMLAAGWTAPPALAAAAAPATSALSALAADGLEASLEEKVRAAAVVGVVAPDSWIVKNDWLFVFEIWKVATGDELRAAAELALQSGSSGAAGTPFSCTACTVFIQASIYEANALDVAKEIRDAEAARLSREARQRAAATLGLVATPEMLVASDRDFVYQIWRVATGARVKAAAEAAFGATRTEQAAFIATGLRLAHEQDQAQAIIDDQTRTEAEKARQAARDARGRAAAVLGIVATEAVLVLSDDNFVRLIWNESADGTEVNAAAETALRSSTPEDWKTFIDSGIHAANRGDITIALKKAAEEDRRRVREIQAAAQNSRVRPALATAAATALSGTDADVSSFLRTGQYQALTQSFRSAVPPLDRMYIAATGGDAYLATGDPTLSRPLFPVRDADWKVVTGLGDPTCYSLESAAKPGQYLRPANFRVQLAASDGSAQFKKDATWCARTGLTGSGVSLESLSLPGRYLRQLDRQLWAANASGQNAFDRACGFTHGATWFVSAPSPNSNINRFPLEWDPCTAVQPKTLRKLVGGSFNGDAYIDDLLGVGTDSLTSYNASWVSGRYHGSTTLGDGGWGSMKIMAGRFSDDAIDDVMAIDDAGNLWLHPGTGGLLGTRAKIGSGWGALSKVTAGDFDGNGYDDVVVVDPANGKLWLYPWAGSAFGTRVQIGSGWNNAARIAAGDMNGDNREDIVAVEQTTGELWLYPGTGNGLASRQQIGVSGWAAMTELAVSDLTRDRHNDVIVLDGSGKYWAYPNTGNGTLGKRFEIK